MTFLHLRAWSVTCRLWKFRSLSGKATEGCGLTSTTASWVLCWSLKSQLWDISRCSSFLTLYSWSSYPSWPSASTYTANGIFILPLQSSLCMLQANQLRRRSLRTPLWKHTHPLACWTAMSTRTRSFRMLDPPWPPGVTLASPTQVIRPQLVLCRMVSCIFILSLLPLHSLTVQQNLFYPSSSKTRYRHECSSGEWSHPLSVGGRRQLRYLSGNRSD